MPTYPYRCEKCDDTFDLYLKIDERDNPLNENCAKCGCKSIVRDYTTFKQPIASDTNMTPDKKTQGQWSQLMNRMKKGIPKRFHSTLDGSTDRSGRKWN
jgi:putative FmdB family regulatory protein